MHTVALRTETSLPIGTNPPGQSTVYKVCTLYLYIQYEIQGIILLFFPEWLLDQSFSYFFIYILSLFLHKSHRRKKDEKLNNGRNLGQLTITDYLVLFLGDDQVHHVRLPFDGEMTPYSRIKILFQILFSAS